MLHLTFSDFASAFLLLVAGFSTGFGVWRRSARSDMEARMTRMEKVTDAQTAYITILVGVLKAQVPPLDVPAPPIELLIH